MNVFISQPMNGKTNEEIANERANAIASLLKIYPNQSIHILDTYFKDFNGNGLQFLGKSIYELGNADIAYFCKDWDKYRGCKIEYICAKEYGVKTICYEGKEC